MKLTHSQLYPQLRKINLCTDIDHINYLTSGPEYIVDRRRARRIESRLRRLIGIAIRDQILEYEINR